MKARERPRARHLAHQRFRCPFRYVYRTNCHFSSPSPSNVPSTSPLPSSGYVSWCMDACLGPSIPYRVAFSGAPVCAFTPSLLLSRHRLNTRQPFEGHRLYQQDSPAILRHHA